MRRIVVVAVAAIGILVVGLTVARTAHEPPSKSAVSPRSSPDAAVARYIATVNSDDNAIDIHFYKKLTCKSRALCIGELQDGRALVVAMLRDVSEAPPQAFAAAALRIENAAQSLLDQIDAALLVMRRPDGDYRAASSLPNVHDLDMAAGVIVCWPASPKPLEGYEFTQGYLCR